MKEKNYTTLEDFVNDPSFVSFVYQTNKSDEADWTEWLTDHPQFKELADEAATILHHLRLKEKPVSSDQLATAELRLRTAMKNEKRSAKVISIRKKILYWSAAAVVLLSLTFGLKFLFHSEKMHELATSFGQVKKEHLPDGTEVILNAHSKLLLGDQWKEGNMREVWLKGEAFFHVKKTPKHDKFIVHTDAFDIEVTGTSFNVRNMNGKSSITLEEGSVTIHRENQPDIKMKPGDYVVFENNQLEKKVVSKNDYMVWTQNKLVFDNTKISEVAKIIKEHYGVEVNVDPGIADKTITGIMPNDKLEVLLSSLEGTQEFSVTKNGNTVTINKHQ